MLPFWPVLKKLRSHRSVININKSFITCVLLHACDLTAAIFQYTVPSEIQVFLVPFYCKHALIRNASVLSNSLTQFNDG